MKSIFKVVSLFLSTILLACGQTPVVIPTPPTPPTVQVPKQLVEVFVIDPATPVGQPTVTLNLSKTPASNTTITVNFHSSQYGWDFIKTYTPVGPNTKQILLTVPSYRPFTGADQVEVSYSTNDN